MTREQILLQPASLLHHCMHIYCIAYIGPREHKVNSPRSAQVEGTRERRSKLPVWLLTCTCTCIPCYMCAKIIIPVLTPVVMSTIDPQNPIKNLSTVWMLPCHGNHGPSHDIWLSGEVHWSSLRSLQCRVVLMLSWLSHAHLALSRTLHDHPM